MKRAIVFAVVAAVLISTWLAYAKVPQARRETAYRAAMAPFQRDLPVGMSKDDVKKYLDSGNVSYNSVRFGGSEADTYEIKIGEEPGSLVCESWNVYVALEFSSRGALQEVHITKIGNMPMSLPRTATPAANC